MTTYPRVMRRPWSVLAAWEFVSALLASPGLALLVPTQRHADVAGKVTPRASNAAATHRSLTEYS